MCHACVFVISFEAKSMESILLVARTNIPDSRHALKICNALQKKTKNKNNNKTTKRRKRREKNIRNEQRPNEKPLNAKT